MQPYMTLMRRYIKVNGMQGQEDILLLTLMLLVRIYRLRLMLQKAVEVQRLLSLRSSSQRFKGPFLLTGCNVMSNVHVVTFICWILN